MRTALADTAQKTRAVYRPTLKPSSRETLFACRKRLPARRRLSFGKNGRKADGFSRHRTNKPIVPWCCVAALLPPQHQGSMATAFSVEQVLSKKSNL